MKAVHMPQADARAGWPVSGAGQATRARPMLDGGSRGAVQHLHLFL